MVSNDNITERKRAEEQFRLVVEGAPTGMIMVNQAGLIMLVNAQIEKVFGYDRSELLGQSVDLLVPGRFRGQHPGHREGFFAAPSQRAMGGGRELYGLRKDGSEFPLEIGLNPIKTADGVMVMASIIDITERKQTEKSLRQSRERLELAHHIAKLGTFELNFQSGMNSWAPELEAMYGLTPGSFGGTKLEWERLVHPDDLPQVLKRVEEGFSKGRAEGDWRVIWPDGSIHWLSGRWQVFKDEFGMPLRMIGVNKDISEQKRGEMALRESEARFRTMADTAPVLIWISDTTKLCTWFNKPWLDFTGRTMEQEIGNGWAEGVHQEDFERCLSIYSTSFDSRQPFTMEYRLRRHDGDYRWFLDNGIPRFSETHEFVGYIGTCIDITERKRAEKEFQTLNEELERRVVARTAEHAAVNAELEAFSYSVSHDLRAPLRSMEGFSQALLEDYSDILDDQGKNYLHRIASACIRLAHLIDELLELSRVSRSEMHRAPVNLSTMAQVIAKELQETDSHRHVEFLIKEGLVVHGDSRLIRSMMENLIGNAWKYTSKHPRAHIEVGSTSPGDGRVVYFVKDDGAGFEMEYVNKLFGAFQRLHDANEFPGTGVGLATVQRIIHRHGGTVWAEGRPEEGATFYFTL
jgi:PAS domain S-box-containing protein